MKSENDILATVERTLLDRGTMYGDPGQSFAQISEIWTALMRTRLKPGASLSPTDVGLLMAALKLIRETNRHKQDNLIDAVGYLTIVSRMNSDEPH